MRRALKSWSGEANARAEDRRIEHAHRSRGLLERSSEAVVVAEPVVRGIENEIVYLKKEFVVQRQAPRLKRDGSRTGLSTFVSCKLKLGGFR